MRTKCSRRTFCCQAVALVLSACVPIPPMAPDPAFRTKALHTWQNRIKTILARGEVPIIDTEVTYSANYDLDFIIKSMDSLGVAQICPAPDAGMGSKA